MRRWLTTRSARSETYADGSFVTGDLAEQTGRLRVSGLLGLASVVRVHGVGFVLFAVDRVGEIGVGVTGYQPGPTRQSGEV